MACILGCARMESRDSHALHMKAAGMFVDSTDKAVQLKVLKNALAPCSNKLKQAVEKKNLLARAKLPIAVSDLCKLVAAAGFDAKATDSIGEVEPVAA